MDLSKCLSMKRKNYVRNLFNFWLIRNFYHAIILTNRNAQTPLTDIAIFDIASQKWFHQTAAIGDSAFGPATASYLFRSDFCSVIVSAPDNSSHHMYVYPDPLRKA